jgi:hypothetical protein
LTLIDEIVRTLGGMSVRWHAVRLMSGHAAVSTGLLATTWSMGTAIALTPAIGDVSTAAGMAARIQFAALQNCQ